MDFTETDSASVWISMIYVSIYVYTVCIYVCNILFQGQQ